MEKYYHLVKQIWECFEQKELIHVDREKNDRVDALAHLASTKRPGQHRTFIQETLTYLTTDITEVCSSQIAPNGWKSPIWAYLVNKALPQEEVEARKIKLQASLYVVINNEMLSMRTT